MLTDSGDGDGDGGPALVDLVGALAHFLECCTWALEGARTSTDSQ